MVILGILRRLSRIWRLWRRWVHSWKFQVCLPDKHISKKTSISFLSILETCTMVSTFVCLLGYPDTDSSCRHRSIWWRSCWFGGRPWCVSLHFKFYILISLIHFLVKQVRSSIALWYHGHRKVRYKISLLLKALWSRAPLSHELYIYNNTLDMYKNFAPKLGGRYLSSNVNITVQDQNGSWVNVPVGGAFISVSYRPFSRLFTQTVSESSGPKSRESYPYY